MSFEMAEVWKEVCSCMVLGRGGVSPGGEEAEDDWLGMEPFCCSCDASWAIHLERARSSMFTLRGGYGNVNKSTIIQP